MLHVFNNTVIPYGYCNIWSWDKDHLTQHEMAIPIIYRFLQKHKGYLSTEKELLNGLKHLNNCCFDHL